MNVKGDKQDSATVTEAHGHPVTLSPCHLVTLSSLRAWCYLIYLSWQRQARARQMVWIALALLGFTASVIALNTAAGKWSMGHWRAPRRDQTREEWRKTPTNQQALDALVMRRNVFPAGPAVVAVQDGVLAAYGTVLDRSGFFIFSRWVVFSIFLSFLLPVWSLSFATEALAREREGGSLVWLLTRPLPRSAIYLAKFVGFLPWSLGLNLGGFGLLCLAAGRPGLLAFRLYWPAVLWSTLAFAALFHLMGALFRRPAVVAIAYSFFLETILGNMPGYMKRVSIGFYTRCSMFEAAEGYGVQTEKPSVYLPVDGTTAWWVLAGGTVFLLAVGMIVFARTEYSDGC